METDSCVYRGFSHRLPREMSFGGETYDEIFERRALEPLLFGSVKFVDFGGDRCALMVGALNLRTRRRCHICVQNLSFFAAIPDDPGSLHRCGPLLKKYRPAEYALSEDPSRWSFSTTLFNGDMKTYIPLKLTVFDSIASVEGFVGSALRLVDDVYTFGDYKCTHEGNTVCVLNNLLCCNLYFVRETESNLYTPGMFLFDAKKTADVHINLPTVIHSLKREAALDIETVYDPDFKDADLICDVFYRQNKAATLQAEEYYKTVKVLGVTLPKPPTGLLANIFHITSVALTVFNYDRPKLSPTHRRKDLIVYYQTKLTLKPPESIPTEHMGLEEGRIQLVAAPTEYDMLLALAEKLADSVDILYIYNAQFDYTVLKQRVDYYAFEGRTRTCCAEHQRVTREMGEHLRATWERFICRYPQMIEHKITTGYDSVIAHYLTMMKGIIQMPNSTDPVRRATMAKLKVENFNRNKKTVQNFKFSGFDSGIIDLMYVCKQPWIEAKNGSLNAVARVVIRRFNPKKNPLKSQKMDMPYSKMDAAFRAGGTRLMEVLVYNVIDVALLVRMARYLKPVEELAYRLISTFNCDIICHTRGMGAFNGFVQSVKSVEMSRLKSRIDYGIVAGVKGRKLFEPEKLKLEGGYVAQPITGLFFAQPTQSLELNLDFASLYPSSMCDFNISPETIVDAREMIKCVDYIGFNWNLMDKGFPKYTLVMKVDRTDPARPRVIRHFSDTALSLKRYLNMRTSHKKLLAEANRGMSATDDPEVKAALGLKAAYHNRLQSEMKICANTHYGVSERTCSLMITTSGQHKIKFVNKHLKKINCPDGYKLFPNYGDTDSTMFFHPPIQTEVNMEDTVLDHSDELREYVRKKLSRDVTEAIKTKIGYTEVFIDSFLASIEKALFDDFLSAMVIVDADGVVHNTRRIEGELAVGGVGGFGMWVIKDPVTGLDMDCSTAYLDGMITKLEYENASSIGCHMTKKMVSCLMMVLTPNLGDGLFRLFVHSVPPSLPVPIQYVCLVHEIGGGRIRNTSLKLKGITGIKSSRFGATEMITKDFIDIIYRGHLLKHIDDLERLGTVAWDGLEEGAIVYHFNVEPVFVAGECVNRQQLSLVPHRVLDVWSEPDEELGGRLVGVDLVDCSSGRRLTRVAFLVSGFLFNHFVSWASVLYRELAFIALSTKRAFLVAAGFHDWTNNVLYAKIDKFKPAYVETRRNYGLFDGKSPKIPYVGVDARKTPLYKLFGTKNIKWRGDYHKQEPAMAVFRRYPMNMRLDILIRDYFGGGLKCCHMKKAVLTPAPAPAKKAKAPPKKSSFFEPPKFGGSKHHLQIKNFIDRYYLNDKCKFLLHVMVESHMFRGVFPSSRDRDLAVEGIVKRAIEGIIAIKTAIESAMVTGTGILDAMYRNIPPDMIPGNVDYRYKPGLDRSVVALGSPIVWDASQHGDPAAIYDRRVAELRAMIPGLSIDSVAFGKRKSAYDSKTLTVVPPRLARDLDVEPHLWLLTDDTGEGDLIRFGQKLYIATLMRHVLDGALLDTHETILSHNVVSVPPRRLTPEELKRWISEMKSMIEASDGDIRAHCGGCHQFWVTVDPHKIIQRCYRREGGEYVRQTALGCLEER